MEEEGQNERASSCKGRQGERVRREDKEGGRVITLNTVPIMFPAAQPYSIKAENI